MSTATPGVGPNPITISYPLLQSDPDGLKDQLATALGSGPGCLGIVVISDLPPYFPELRERMFRLAHRFATLPDDVKERFARPETSYMFGWSHGKEVMNGRPDTQKGSYYANPLLDRPDVSDEVRSSHPEYYAGNVWPEGVEGLDEFESTFKRLGQLIFEVGVALAKACDPFVSSTLSTDGPNTISSLISSSKSNKARLLHYYPEPPSETTDVSETILQNDALCGTHLDHSLLTGLCSAMYLSNPSSSDSASEAKVVPPPSDSTGLWIYPRNSEEAVKVSIPANCLAFQTGEALSILTSGKLAATPHFVSGSTATTGPDPVSRETFAFFLQPDVDDIIGPDGETFGGFTKRVLGRHYADKLPQEAED